MTPDLILMICGTILMLLMPACYALDMIIGIASDIYEDRKAMREYRAWQAEHQN